MVIGNLPSILHVLFLRALSTFTAMDATPSLSEDAIVALFLKYAKIGLQGHLTPFVKGVEEQRPLSFECCARLFEIVRETPQLCTYCTENLPCVIFDSTEHAMNFIRWCVRKGQFEAISQMSDSIILEKDHFFVGMRMLHVYLDEIDRAWDDLPNLSEDDLVAFITFSVENAVHTLMRHLLPIYHDVAAEEGRFDWRRMVTRFRFMRSLFQDEAFQALMQSAEETLNYPIFHDQPEGQRYPVGAAYDIQSFYTMLRMLDETLVMLDKMAEKHPAMNFAKMRQCLLDYVAE